MTTWHWIRHGPTHAKTFVGWRDMAADLSDADQIERLSAYLPSDALLVSSDLSRARDTATAIGTSKHKRLPNDPHLREIHFGNWDGQHFDQVAAKYPKLSRAFWETPGDTASPGGESWDMAAARVQAAVTRINGLNTGNHVIAVAHFGVILTQLQRALGIDAYDVLAYPIDNFSVTTLKWHQDGAATVSCINHLP